MKLKLSLLAAAALCTAHAAHAQSSITLFGVVDASLSSYSATSRFVGDPTASGQAPTVTQHANKIANSAFAPSRLGFRGTEDLGGGMSAGFWLEGQIYNDDGGGSFNFSRRSTVSLMNPWGELRLGRDVTVLGWNNYIGDPFGVMGVGGFAPLQIFGYVSAMRGVAAGQLPSDNYIWSSNSVGYFLPPNLGGIYGQVQYALGEGPSADTASNAGKSKKAGGFWGGRIGYDKGPVNVALAYGEDNKDGLVTPGKSRIKTFNVAGTYDFGPVKLIGQLTQLRDEQAPTGAARANGVYDGGLLGFTAPMLGGMVRCAYDWVKYNAPNGTSAQNNDATLGKLALGYVYFLSQRTLLYATAAYTRTHFNGAVNIPIALTASTVAYSTGLSGSPAGYAPTHTSGYDFGILHSF